MDWEVVAHGYGLAEAPTIDIDASVVFSDVLGGGVYRIDAAGNVTTIVPKRRGVGGIAVHADGGIVCSGRDLVHVHEDHEPRTVLHVDGVAGWNDLCTDTAGAFTPARCASRCSIPRPRSFPESCGGSHPTATSRSCSATSCMRMASRALATAARST